VTTLRNQYLKILKNSWNI